MDPAPAFQLQPMTPDACATIRSWRYPPPYDFYDLEADEHDLAEFLNPGNWPGAYFVVHDPEGEVVGFFVFDRRQATATVGLGLRPDLTDKGLGTRFVAAGLEYGARELGVERYELEVATFNQRAINVYRRLAFQVVETFDQHTNGAVVAFVRMRAPAVRRGACVLLASADRRVALQLRDDKPHVGSADCWGLFGGMVEADESPRETIVREMREELDLVLRAQRLEEIRRITTPLGLRSHVFLYPVGDDLSRARLREGQRYALVGPQEITHGRLQGKTVIPYHLSILREFWSSDPSSGGPQSR
jgi:ribosomal-protein-alanine N-acetyltransferase